MKFIQAMLAFGVLSQSVSCQQIEERNYEINLEVVDDTGNPVAKAMALTGKLEMIKNSVAPLSNPVLLQPVLTDINGIAIIKFKSVPTPEGNVNVYKDGFYQTHCRALWNRPHGEDESVAVKVILKPVKNPIPMLVRRELRIRTPEFITAYGFDLEMGEALPPFGKGRTADISFKLEGTRSVAADPNREFIDLKMSIECPNKLDGFVEFVVDDAIEFSKGSALASGHEAPIDQYINQIYRTFKTDKDGGFVRTFKSKHEDENKCYYFRVRTKIDAQGRIESAHYGKMYGPLEIKPAMKEYGHDVSKGQGGFFINYLYFNPNPNDKNVEFDTKRNLIPEQNVNIP